MIIQKSEHPVLQILVGLGVGLLLGGSAYLSVDIIAGLDDHSLEPIRFQSKATIKPPHSNSRLDRAHIRAKSAGGTARDALSLLPKPVRKADDDPRLLERNLESAREALREQKPLCTLSLPDARMLAGVLRPDDRVDLVSADGQGEGRARVLAEDLRVDYSLRGTAVSPEGLLAFEIAPRRCADIRSHSDHLRVLLRAPGDRHTRAGEDLSRKGWTTRQAVARRENMQRLREPGIERSTATEADRAALPQLDWMLRRAVTPPSTGRRLIALPMAQSDSRGETLKPGTLVDLKLAWTGEDAEGETSSRSRLLLRRIAIRGYVRVLGERGELKRVRALVEVSAEESMLIDLLAARGELSMSPHGCGRIGRMIELDYMPGALEEGARR